MEFKTKRHELSECLGPLDAQVKNSDEPIPFGHRLWIITGRRGSGKSTIILQVLQQNVSKWHKNFDNIIFISPTASHDPKFKRLVDETKNNDNFYNELNEEVFTTFLNKLSEFNDIWEEDEKEYKYNKKEHGKGFYTRVIKKVHGKEIIKKYYELRPEPQHLLILDDCIEDLKKSTQKSKLNKAICNGRHFKLSTIITTQRYNKLNTLIRSNADMISIFRTENNGEYRTIEDDLTIDNNLLKDVYDFATEKPNGFLHISLADARPCFFRRFDKIIF